MIQNVCLNDDGKPLRMSPLDDRCLRQRDLLPGEALPYHKDDWPALKDRLASPAGKQRGDSFPLLHKELGLVAFHTFDWGDGVRKFGRYDGINGDGGSLVVVASGMVGSILTIDQRAGVQLLVNKSACHGSVDLQGLLVGWPFAAADTASDGVHYSQLKRVQNFGEACPASASHVITVWYFTGFAPMVATGEAGKKQIHTLISEHYSGTDIDNSPNMERMYFSRELGRMRWERWQNLSRQERSDDLSRTEKLADDGRCIGGVGKPNHAGEWVMVACHEWTNIVLSSNPSGDSVSPWLVGLIGATHAAPLLELSGY
jgi:hypothetical protein